MAGTWLPLIQCLFDAVAPSEQLISPPPLLRLPYLSSQQLLPHPLRGEKVASLPSKLLNADCRGARSSANEELWASVTVEFGGGGIRSSMHICVGVFTAEEDEGLHSFSRAAETWGWKVEAMEEDREERLFSQETQPQSSSSQASDFFIKYLRNVHLRCGTFAPDWKVCKHRSGVNPRRADLFCFHAPNDEEKKDRRDIPTMLSLLWNRDQNVASRLKRTNKKKHFNYKQSILASAFDLSSELLFKKKT